MKVSTEEVRNDVYALYRLTVRNLKMFLTDKVEVFFSLLAPLIVLVLYKLFLGDVQVSSVKSFVPEGLVVDEKAIKAYVDSWMIAGVLSVACITVSLSANSVMVEDKEHGILNDGLSSPVKRRVIKASYFLFNFTVTLAIVTVVYLICLIYLAISGGWYLSVGDVFGVFGVIIFSSLSSTLITVFICDFLKSEAQHGGIVGIMSAVIGFFIGAYMPMSIMPKVAQYISAIIPGSHSSGLFKHFLMSGALENLGTALPAEMVAELSEAFAMEVNLFGKFVGAPIMCVYLAASIVVFAAVNLIFSSKKKLGK